MDELATYQTGLLCKNCGGQCAYDPGQQDLLCQSCGTHWPIHSPWGHAAKREFPYDPDMPQEEAPAFRNERVHHCETCGGEMLFTGPTLSENCPYCNGPVVLGVEGSAYRTMALVPFQVDEKNAVTCAAKWLRRRIAAPNDLRTQAAKGRLVGIYVPFWTFDSKEAIEYWATYTRGSGNTLRMDSFSCRFNTHFDDLLVPASPHVTPLIRDGILHDFKPDRLRPYQPNYLAGFAAERHHMTIDEGLRANEDDKALLIRNKIKQRIHQKAAKIGGYRTDTSGIHYRRILLPVWILHYSYNDEDKKIVVSGIDGRTFGERTYSVWKLAVYSAGIVMAVMAFGWFWGAGSVP
ncbi:hypothetical protein ROA7450_02667 [Roseovarius albus]|uniref:Uncharacterized protein n=1 Tax=Roseovarius albus TaxID=1247867 RepID=A0A1X6ZIT7_9RHOB|nr:hypothetical protein [Roseovarius albus]SLN52757.1 hypothetical protein ROA7450_02667 [Roseovarius albus]